MHGIREFLLARFTWLQVIGIMQAITVSLNYTLASPVSTAVSLQFLRYLTVIGIRDFRLAGSHCIQTRSLITSSVKPWSQDWLIAARAYPGFCSMKRLEVFLLPLDGMLVHRRSPPRNLSGFPNNLLAPIYTPGWREALRVKCLAQEHNTMSPARARTSKKR